MMMNARASKRPHNMVAHLFAGIGAVIILTELVRYWAWAHRMEGFVIAIGAGFGFVGAYAADRKAALEGGDFIVGVAMDGVSLLRTGKLTDRGRLGRRATDPVVVPHDEIVGDKETP